MFSRSSDDKIVAGVCAGLGRATNVDPIVYRVLAVILTFFGGAGLLLYALGWLLLPEDRTGVSLSERALGRARTRQDSNRAGAIALMVLLVLVAAITVAGVVNSWTATVLVLLVVGGIFLLLRRDSGTPVATSTPATAPVPAAAGVGATTWYAPAGPTSDSAAAGVTTPAATPSAPAAPSGPGGPGAPDAPSYADWGPPPPPQRQSKPAGVLGPLTISVLLISLGVLAAVDASGASIPAAAYPALALVVVGLGLLVGTWYGRSRALIALGILAALALPPTIAADVFDRGEFRRGGDQHVNVSDVGQIRSNYGFRPGRAELDLTAADFGGRTIRTHVEMPGGELQVLVPQNVDVVANVDLGVGDTRVLGRESGGIGISERVEDLGADGRGGGALELRIEQGVGSVEVQREAA